MPLPHDVDSIADDELLYRRIPVAQDYYDPGKTPPLSPNAYKPHERDIDGLSLERARSAGHPEFCDAAECCADGRSPKGYFVAVMRVRDLRQRGIRVNADPLANKPGHALLPDMNSANRKSDSVAERMRVLAHELTIEVLGPYYGRSD
jgi:hypothetical protein